MGYNCDKCGRRVEMDRVISCLCGTKYCQQCLEARRTRRRIDEQNI